MYTKYYYYYYKNECDIISAGTYKNNTSGAGGLIDFWPPIYSFIVTAVQ